MAAFLSVYLSPSVYLLILYSSYAPRVSFGAEAVFLMPSSTGFSFLARSSAASQKIVLDQLQAKANRVAS